MRSDAPPSAPAAPPSAPAAPPSAPAAPSGPRSRAPYADCDLSYLQTGVFSAPAPGVFVRRPAASCQRVTGASVRRPAASRPAGSRNSFCTSTSLSITASRSPLTSSTLNVKLPDNGCGGQATLAIVRLFARLLAYVREVVDTICLRVNTEMDPERVARANSLVTFVGCSSLENCRERIHFAMQAYGGRYTGLVPCPGLFYRVYKTSYDIFPDMPCMKKVYRDKKATAQWSAARNEERPSSRC